ncbi:hypothetical protein TIFTF001_053146 [Ficus carica]|uniref:Uncharacterized protein n=1 Tax=Ficus carica TaxID=3494 RepID=A0AA88EG60_FICCA|nr:hypothetical protein TIFTF001_053143 [Ficus carica]GMN74343.1 hypothetical protein TIFTF001_053144 [Ficus carica]GMN74349.1 hypothetical protein TIFTF001_053145 [Ficus carica]GMN74353.1 hypothetical protein TIFTF001_053146 [Ficus carica]
MTGHYKEETHHGLALGETPHGLALMSKPPLALHPWQAKACTTHHLRPATTRRRHLMLLALVSKLPSFAYLAIWDKNGRPPHRDFDKDASLAYWLARASSMLHIWPAIPRSGHLMLLALVSKLP